MFTACALFRRQLVVQAWLPPLLAASVLLACGDPAGDPDPAAPRLGLRERPPNPTCRPPAAINAPAVRLSETGCVDPSNPRRPAPGLIPYDVASPLWSDGATKERYLALPEGKRVRVKDCSREPRACDSEAPPADGRDDGHWELPVGSVLVKTFALAGRRIETRLLVRWNELTWKGYSYAWNDSETEADLVADAEGGLMKAVTNGSITQLWHFPGRAQCLQCHTEAAGVSLGPSTTQLNRDFGYPTGVTSNQVATWAHIGLFEEAPAQPYLPALPGPGAEEPGPVARARFYLHANCANCHRPGGSFEGIDLRYETPLGQMGLCNVLPEKGNLGVEGALRLIPGDPERSVVSLRMHTVQDGRMPQIGTSVVDVVGVALVDDWIRTMQACPPTSSP